MCLLTWWGKAPLTWFARHPSLPCMTPLVCLEHKPSLGSVPNSRTGLAKPTRCNPPKSDSEKIDVNYKHPKIALNGLNLNGNMRR